MAQQKYSAYDRELLAIYEAMKHFRHMLEAQHFTIFTDHKPITYAFQQRQDKCSPRQFNHLDFVAQFMTDIRHISGQDNVVADAVSCIESVTAPPSYNALATAQEGDNELRTLLLSATTLRLEKLPAPAPPSPSTLTRLPGDTDHTFQVPCSFKCSSPSMSCCILALRPQQNSSRSASYGQACRRIAAPGHGHASAVSVLKSPATR
jgi:hypothetical protein